MMEGTDRAQSRRRGGGSEFFICFTARPSSSASASSTTMRAPSSKSLMSPGRGRDPAAPSLSASLSRRLRRGGSVKGGQSPMFSAGVSTAGAGGRRKGCAFEAAEPSSPKVTCIGQVRVKSKKKGIVVARSGSQRRGGGGDASFRRPLFEQERECLPSSRSNQSWVYQLPVSICDALRALGSEISCLLPCGGRSPCSSSSSTAAGRNEGAGGKSSCAAVLARWVMAIQEEEEGKRGEVVGLVVEERDKGDQVGILIRERDKGGEVGFVMRERDMVDPMISMEKKMVEKKEEVVVVEEDEGGRVSVCIPPRNALLLMRCRSDPVRVAALANRFWGSPDTAKLPRQEEQGRYREATQEDDLQHHSGSEEEEAQDLRQEADQVACDETGQEAEEDKTTAVHSTHVEVASAVTLEEEEEEKISEVGEERQHLYDEITGISTQGRESQLQEECRDEEAGDGEDLVEEMEGGRSTSSSASRRSSVYAASSKTKEWARRRSCSYREKEKRRNSFSSAEAKRHSFSTEREARRASFSVDRDARSRWSFSLEKEDLEMPKDKDHVVTMAEAEALEEQQDREEMQIGAEANVTREAENPKDKEEAQAAGEGEMGGRKTEEMKKIELPDCLLMMMYEPKLSMEVSRETWVCNSDFIRWRPHHARRTQQATTKADDGGATVVTVESVNVQTPPPPPRPTPPPPATPALPPATEEKLKVATPYGGPLVLTRCKSEPMRSSARLAADACFWKNRHQPIGAAGIGF